MEATWRPLERAPNPIASEVTDYLRMVNETLRPEHLRPPGTALNCQMETHAIYDIFYRGDTHDPEPALVQVTFHVVA
jgi:hypothetical protein